MDGRRRALGWCGWVGGHHAAARVALREFVASSYLCLRVAKRLFYLILARGADTLSFVVRTPFFVLGAEATSERRAPSWTALMSGFFRRKSSSNLPATPPPAESPLSEVKKRIATIEKLPSDSIVEVYQPPESNEGAMSRAKAASIAKQVDKRALEEEAMAEADAKAKAEADAKAKAVAEEKAAEEARVAAEMKAETARQVAEEAKAQADEAAREAAEEARAADRATAEAAATAAKQAKLKEMSSEELTAMHLEERLGKDREWSQGKLMDTSNSLAANEAESAALAQRLRTSEEEAHKSITSYEEQTLSIDSMLQVNTTLYDQCVRLSNEIAASAAIAAEGFEDNKTRFGRVDHEVDQARERLDEQTKHCTQLQSDLLQFNSTVAPEIARHNVDLMKLSSAHEAAGKAVTMWEDRIAVLKVHRRHVSELEHAHPKRAKQAGFSTLLPSSACLCIIHVSFRFSLAD